MRKSIILFAIAFGGLCYTANAQGHGHKHVISNDNFVNRHLKAEKGDFTSELGLSGGLNNTGLELNEGDAGLLRFRYFVNDNWALRLGFSLSMEQEKDNIYDVLDNSKMGTVRTSSGNFLINVGAERHFSGTARLSPYVGADLLFGVFNQKVSESNTDGSTYVSGLFTDTKGPGAVSFGVRAVFGADYYFTKHVYLGLEAGLGFLYTYNGEVKIEHTNSGHSTKITVPSPGSSYELKPSVITGVRVGFVF